MYGGSSLILDCVISIRPSARQLWRSKRLHLHSFRRGLPRERDCAGSAESRRLAAGTRVAQSVAQRRRPKIGQRPARVSDVASSDHSLSVEGEDSLQQDCGNRQVDKYSSHIRKPALTNMSGREINRFCLVHCDVLDKRASHKYRVPVPSGQIPGAPVTILFRSRNGESTGRVRLPIEVHLYVTLITIVISTPT